ncbi:hypothetical protein GIB67_017486 [Kingdonia uniflora]|uniref:B box-type domain-containing protein n=1 Tax=Kingdonia uniflora TaxID=39325 RepID=A0A7J7M4F9_9MAGN|nr:hypothetical protein GIB67_017486 [Kingdonia uniflora]
MKKQLESNYGWVFSLVSETFFNPCVNHKDDETRKTEANMFCFRCCSKICSFCENLHTSHPLLRVRRYVYNDVVKIDDMKEVFDCSYVQVSLTSSFEFGVEYLTGKRISRKKSYGGDYKLMDVHVDGVEDGQITPNSVLELDRVVEGSPYCETTTSDFSSNNNGNLACTATSLTIYDESKVTRKKRSVKPAVKRVNNEKAIAPTTSRIVGKRKGIPHRSPLL